MCTASNSSPSYDCTGGRTSFALTFCDKTSLTEPPRSCMCLNIVTLSVSYLFCRTAKSYIVCLLQVDQSVFASQGLRALRLKQRRSPTGYLAALLGHLRGPRGHTWTDLNSSLRNFCLIHKGRKPGRNLVQVAVTDQSHLWHLCAFSQLRFRFENFNLGLRRVVLTDRLVTHTARHA